MSELLANLGIDGKLLIAQLINFAILLFVLKKFLYKPILDFLDKRKKLIQEGLENAEKIDEKLEAISEKEDRTLTKARSKAKVIIDDAKGTGTDEAAKIVTAAEERVEKMVADAQQKIDAERESMLKEAREQLGELVIAATKKVVTTSTSDSVDKSIVDSAVKKLT